MGRFSQIFVNTRFWPHQAFQFNSISIRSLQKEDIVMENLPKAIMFALICTLRNWREWNLLQAKSFVLIKILGINYYHIAVTGTFL